MGDPGRRNKDVGAYYVDVGLLGEYDLACDMFELFSKA